MINYYIILRENVNEDYEDYGTFVKLFPAKAGNYITSLKKTYQMFSRAYRAENIISVSFFHITVLARIIFQPIVGGYRGNYFREPR